MCSAVSKESSGIGIQLVCMFLEPSSEYRFPKDLLNSLGLNSQMKLCVPLLKQTQNP